ncbi:MAG: substrate-binding domain-containing protein [Eubacteriales bacterium]|nr:substrate-binding domain-containing protein [Eubacteriales bacterium]
MKKLLTLSLIVAMLVTLIAGCAAPAATTAAPAANEPAATTEAAAPAVTGGTYALIVKNTGNPYNEKEAEGFVKAVEEFGGTAIVKRPANPTAEDQIAMINELVSQKVAAIAIAANDADALQPAIEKATAAGIKVISLDSATNPASRLTHVQQADPVAIGRVLVEAAFDMSGGSGEFAILSATSTATNQNTWIANMEKLLKEDAKYKDLKLVKTAYGDDLRDKSVSETEALLQTYPDLKVIVAPTTVGIAAAAKVVTDKGLLGKVIVTGLGLPSEMAEYMSEGGACPYMFLWNPIDIGYLAGYTAKAMVEGATGAVGDKIAAGTLGERIAVTATSGDGGTEVVLGDPFKFETANIAEWSKVY